MAWDCKQVIVPHTLERSVNTAVTSVSIAATLASIVGKWVNIEDSSVSIVDSLASTEVKWVSTEDSLVSIEVM